MKVTFLDTSHPLLDSKTYIVKAQNDRQLRVCDTSGSALTEQADAFPRYLSCPATPSYLEKGNSRDALCGVLCIAHPGYSSLLSFAWCPTFLSNLFVGSFDASDWCSVSCCSSLVVSSGKRPLERDLCHFAAQSKFETRQCPKGPGRAICLQQLEDLYSFFSHHIGFRNMYYLCSNLVKPLTMQVALSYAELVGPSSVQWFVSHFWACHLNISSVV